MNYEVFEISFQKLSMLEVILKNIFNLMYCNLFGLFSVAMNHTHYQFIERTYMCIDLHEISCWKKMKQVLGLPCTSFEFGNLYGFLN